MRHGTRDADVCCASLLHLSAGSLEVSISHGAGEDRRGSRHASEVLGR